MQAGSFQVAEVAPGEILFRFSFPGTPMAGAMWLGVRLPSENTPRPALSNAPHTSSPPRGVAGNRGASGATKEANGEAAGEVEFYFGTALWEASAGEGVPEHMTSGVGGTVHRWYSQILLWTAVQRLHVQKPLAVVVV